jgi:hypothetical protein
VRVGLLAIFFASHSLLRSGGHYGANKRRCV